MTHRPLGNSPRFRRGAFAAAGALALGMLAACANPNFIGLQDFGTVNGNVVDQNGKPISQALVSITGSNSAGVYTQSNGSFTLVNIAVGEQTLSVSAAGYTSNNSTTVIVLKNQNVTAGNIVLTSTVAGH